MPIYANICHTHSTTPASMRFFQSSRFKRFLSVSMTGRLGELQGPLAWLVPLQRTILSVEMTFLWIAGFAPGSRKNQPWPEKGDLPIGKIEHHLSPKPNHVLQPCLMMPRLLWARVPRAPTRIATYSAIPTVGMSRTTCMVLNKMNCSGN